MTQTKIMAVCTGNHGISACVTAKHSNNSDKNFRINRRLESYLFCTHEVVLHVVCGSTCSVAISRFLLLVRRPIGPVCGFCDRNIYKNINLTSTLEIITRLHQRGNHPLYTSPRVTTLSSPTCEPDSVQLCYVTRPFVFFLLHPTVKLHTWNLLPKRPYTFLHLSTFRKNDWK